MQPYFLPYVGYFQLMQHCDVFVVYDDIQYSKKGWINRNRLLFEGAPRTFTLPLQSDSDYLDVRDRTISPVFSPDKLMTQFNRAYREAPYWEEISGLLRGILQFPSRNLFAFIANSVTDVATHLHITSTVVVSSDLGVDRSLRGQARVLATCEALGATEYVNPIGGLELYCETDFRDRGIDLSFLRSEFPPYTQFASPFVKGLSIADVLMFVEPTSLSEALSTAFQRITK